MIHIVLKNGTSAAAEYCPNVHSMPALLTRMEIKGSAKQVPIADLFRGYRQDLWLMSLVTQPRNLSAPNSGHETVAEVPGLLTTWKPLATEMSVAFWNLVMSSIQHMSLPALLQRVQRQAPQNQIFRFAHKGGTRQSVVEES